MWHRYLATIIAGATRFGDRVIAAKICEPDLCDHPRCDNARCDAEHWFCNCHHNKANVDKAETVRQGVLDEVRANSYRGEQRYRELCEL